MKTTLLSTYMRRTLSSLAMLLGLGSITAFGQTTITWAGASSGTAVWNLASNWTPATIPNLNTHIAIFPTGLTNLVVTDMPAATTVGALRVQGSSSVTIRPGATNLAAVTITAGNTAGGAFNPALEVQTNAKLTITGFDNPAGIDLNLTVTLNNNAAVTASVAGTLVIEQEDDINFTGTGILTTPAAAVLTYTATGIYEHAFNGGTLPFANAFTVLTAGSTVLVTGSRTILPTITTASVFHHLIIDVPNLITNTTALTVAATTAVTVNGDFTVNRSGSGYINLGINSGALNFIVAGLTTIGLNTGSAPAIVGIKPPLGSGAGVLDFRLGGNLVVNLNGTLTSGFGTNSLLTFTGATSTATGTGTVNLGTNAFAATGTGASLTIPASVTASWSIANSTFLGTTVALSGTFNPLVSGTYGSAIAGGGGVTSYNSTITGSFNFLAAADISVTFGNLSIVATGALRLNQASRNHQLTISGLTNTLTVGGTFSAGTSIVTYNGLMNSQQVIQNATYNKLVIDGNLFALNTKAGTGTGPALVNDTLVLQAGILGGTYNVNHIKRIDGSVSSTIAPIATTYSLTYDRPTAIFSATIGSEWATNAAQVGAVIVNLGAGKVVYMGASRTLNGQMRFLTGHIVVQSTFALTFANTATHTGSSNGSHIQTQGTGVVNRTSTVTTDFTGFTWPIGSGGQLATVSPSAITITSAAVTLGFRSFPSRSPFTATSANQLNRFWQVAYTGLMTNLTATYDFGASELIGAPTVISQRAPAATTWTTVAAGAVGGTSLTGVQNSSIPVTNYEIAAGDATSFLLTGYKVLNAAAWTTAGNWTPSGVPIGGENIIINAGATLIPANFACASLQVTSNGSIPSAAYSFTVTGETIIAGSTASTSGQTYNGNLTLIGAGTLPNTTLGFNGAGNQTITYNGIPSSNVAQNHNLFTNSGTRTVTYTGTSAMTMALLSIGQGVTTIVDVADQISGFTVNNQVTNHVGSTTGRLVLNSNRVITFNGAQPNAANAFSAVTDNSKTDFTAAGCRVRYAGVANQTFPGDHAIMEVNGAGTVLANNVTRILEKLDMRGASTLLAGGASTVLHIGTATATTAFVDIQTTASPAINLAANVGSIVINTSVNPFPFTAINNTYGLGNITCANLTLDPTGDQTYNIRRSFAVRNLTFSNVNGGADNISFDPLSTVAFTVVTSPTAIAGTNPGTLSFGRFTYTGIPASVFNIDRNIRFAPVVAAGVTFSGALTTAPIVNVASGVIVDFAFPLSGTNVTFSTSIFPTLVCAATSTLNFSTTVNKTMTLGPTSTISNLTNAGGTLAISGGATSQTLNGVITNGIGSNVGILSFASAAIVQAPSGTSSVLPNITGNSVSRTTFSGALTFSGGNNSFTNIDLYVGTSGAGNVTFTNSLIATTGTVYTFMQGGSIFSGAGTFNPFNWKHTGATGSGGLTIVTNNVTVANNFSLELANAGITLGDLSTSPTLTVLGDMTLNGGNFNTITTGTLVANRTPTLIVDGNLTQNAGTFSTAGYANSGFLVAPTINLRMGSGTAQAKTLIGTFASMHNLNIGDNAGDVLTSTATITSLTGSITNTGTLTSTAGIVTVGSTALNNTSIIGNVIGSNPGLTFFNLTTGNNNSTAQIITLGADVTVANTNNIQINNTSGGFALSGFQLTINGQTTGTGPFRGDAAAGTSQLVFATAGGAPGTFSFASSFQNLKALTHNKTSFNQQLTSDLVITASGGNKPSLNLLAGTLDVSSTFKISFKSADVVIRRGIGTVTSGDLVSTGMTSVGYEYINTATVGAGNEVLAGIAVDTLTINGVGATVTAAANIIAAGHMRMTNGIYTLGAINLALSGPSAFIGGSATSYVNIASTGRVTNSRAVYSAGDFDDTWAIGTGSAYTPITISGLAGTIAGGSTISIVPTVGINPNFAVATLGLNRFFTFTTTGITALSGGSLSFTYIDPTDINGNEANYPNNVYYWNGSVWTVSPSPTVNVGANTFGSTNLNGIATLNGTQWTVGELQAFVVDLVYSIAGGGVFTDGTKWSNTIGGAPRGTSPTASEKMVITTGNPITLTNSATTIATEINTGGILSQNAATGTNLGSLTGLGTLRINSNTAPAAAYTLFLNATGGTIDYNGASSITMSNFTTYRNLSVSNTVGVISANDFTLSGNLDVTGKFQNTHVVTLDAATGTISGSDTVRLNNSILPVTRSYAISNTGGVNFSGTTTGTGIITMVAGGKVGYTQAVVPYGITTAELTKTGVTLVVNGTIGQTIPLLMFNLETNKAAGAITLTAGSTIITNNLNMLSGVINYPRLSNRVFVNGSLTVTAPSATNMFNMSGGIAGTSNNTLGFLSVLYSDPVNASTTFPVGANGKYHGLTLTNINGFTSPVLGGYISISTADVKDPLTTSNNTLGQYWRIGTGLTSFTANLTGTYDQSLVVGTEASYLVRFNEGQVLWTIPGTARSVNAATNIFSVTLLSLNSGGVSDIALGEADAFIQTVYSSIASGDWTTAGTWDANGIPDPALGSVILINNGHNVIRTTSLAFAPVSGKVVMLVYSGGTIELTGQSVLSGASAEFTITGGGGLRTQHANGFEQSTAFGCVQTGLRNFSFAGIYEFNRTDGPQVLATFMSAMNGNGRLIVNNGTLTGNNFTTNVFHDQNGFTNGVSLTRPTFTLNENSAIEVRSGVLTLPSTILVGGTSTTPIAVKAGALLRVDCSGSRTLNSVIATTGGIDWENAAPYGSLHLFNIATSTTMAGTNAAGGNMFGTNMNHLVLHATVNSLSTLLSPSNPITIYGNLDIIRVTATSSNALDINLADGATIYKQYPSLAAGQTARFTTAMGFPTGPNSGINLVGENNHSVGLTFTNAEIPNASSGQNITRMILLGSGSQNMIMPSNKVWTVTGLFKNSYASGGFSMDGGGAGNTMTLSGPIQLDNSINFVGVSSNTGTLTIDGSGTFTGSGVFNNSASAFRRITINRPSVAIGLTGSVTNGANAFNNGSLDILNGSVLALGSNNLTVQGDLNMTGGSTITAGTGVLSLTTKAGGNIITASPTGTIPNLEINNSAGVTLPTAGGSNLTVSTSLALTSGSFDIGSASSGLNTFQYNGDAPTGTPANLIATTGSRTRLIYGGTAASYTFNSGIASVKYLESNNTNGSPATITQSGNMTVTDSLVLRSGGFNFGGNFGLSASQDVVRYANGNTTIVSAATTIPSTTTVSYLAGNIPTISTANELPAAVAKIIMNATASTVNQTPTTVTVNDMTLTDGIYNLGSTKTLVYNNNTLPTGEASSYISTLGGGLAGFNWTPSSAAIGTYEIPVGPVGSVTGYRPLTLATTSALSSSTLFSFADHAGGPISDYLNVPTTGNTRTNYLAHITNNGATYNSGLTLEAVPSVVDFNAAPTVLATWSIFEGVNPGPASWIRRGQNSNSSRSSTGAYKVSRGGINFVSGTTQTFVLGINNGTDLAANPITYNWPAASGTGSWNDGAKWYIGLSVANYVPNDVLDNVEINGGTLSIDDASATTYTVNDITIATGQTLALTNSNGLNITGAAVNSGTLTAGASTTIAYIGDNQTILSGSYGNLDLRSPAAVTKTIPATPATTVNATFFVSTGLNIVNEDLLAFGTNATVQKEVSTAGVADPFNAALNTLTTNNLVYVGGITTLPVSFEIPFGGANNVTFNTGNGYVIQTISQDLTANGTTTFDGIGTVVVGDATNTPTSLILNGPVVQVSTAKVQSFHTGTSRLVLSGSGALPSTNFVGNAATWNRVTVNNSHATLNELVLGSNNLTVSNNLSILDGRINLDAATLTATGALVSTSGDGPFNFTTSSNLVTGSATTLPVIATINNLTIGSGGATMGGAVTVGGTLTRNGALIVGTNTLTLNGALAGGSNITTTSSSNLVFGGSTLTVTLPASIATVNNLTLNNSNASNSHGINLGGSLTVVGTLALTDGTLGVGSNTLNINGPVTAASGVINANGSTIVVGGSGSVPATLPFGPTTGGATIGTLTMNRAATTIVPTGTTSATITIATALNLQAGTVDALNFLMNDNSTITPTAGAIITNFSTAKIPVPNTINYVYGSGAADTMGTEMVPNRVKNMTITRSSLTQNIGDITAAGDLTIGTGTTLNLSNGAIHWTFTLRGNLSGDGIITTGGTNYLVFGNTSTKTIANTITLPRVSISSGAFVSAGVGITVTVTGDFLNNGRYTMGSSNLLLNSTYNTLSTGSISTSSSSNLTLGGTVGFSMHNLFFFASPALVNDLTIGNTGGIQMGSQSLTVSGTLLFSSGAGSLSTVAATPTNRIDLGLTGTVSGEIANRYVIGRLRGRRVIVAGVDNNIAGMGVIMSSVTAGTAALMNSLGGSFQLDRITGIAASTSTGNAAQTLSANQSIRRNWVFSPVGTLPSPLNLNLFWVSNDDNENNGGLISSMAIYTRQDAASLWTRVFTPGASRYLNADIGSGNRQLYAQATSFTDFTGGFEAAPLPVEISAFTARRIDRDVRVMWQTATEKNANRFEIQRSLDGIEFTTVGTQQAAGNSAVLLSYNFTDKGIANQVSGIVYYRLHTIDNDGTAEYSNVLSIDLGKGGASKLSLSVKPMPFGEYLDLSFEADDKSTTSVTIMDVSGKVVTTRSYESNAGINSIHLDELQNLPTGVYTLRVITGFQADIIKVVKQ